MESLPTPLRRFGRFLVASLVIFGIVAVGGTMFAAADATTTTVAYVAGAIVGLLGGYFFVYGGR
ncbi:MAG: hypothetical protein SVG88_07190 [Halobacteriales archaeon]|nr:hypothetical protein [Halobacteriales archaeon]